ncbi:MAG: response regulator transcription factor [Synechococcales bacterium]|nr:response regulator transcription factor [Synechococcales bacterium]
MINLLLVDDQTLIRRGLKALLKPEADLKILGEAEHGEAAIAFLTQADPLPDVVLLDVRMPVMDGVATTREICQRFPQVKVLILTTFDDREYVTQALQYGASGYLLKDTPVEELIQAIQLVHKGYTQLAPGLAQKLLEPQSAAEAPPPTVPQLAPKVTQAPSSLADSLAPDRSPSPFDDLTPREKEILHYIASGASNREIAQQLYISEKTVRNHVTNLLGRLGLRDRTQAAIYVHSFSKNE